MAQFFPRLWGISWTLVLCKFCQGGEMFLSLVQFVTLVYVLRWNSYFDLVWKIVWRNLYSNLFKYYQSVVAFEALILVCCGKKKKATFTLNWLWKILGTKKLERKIAHTRKYQEFMWLSFWPMSTYFNKGKISLTKI